MKFNFGRVKKTILAYGGILGLLIILLKWLDYQFLLRDITLEIYIGIIAALCAGLGIWMGLKLTKPKLVFAETSLDFIQDEAKVQELGLSPREIDVLTLMAAGKSNQEIADSLFISLNTVKTHSSSLFSKLGANRRTQAVQIAKELLIIE
ncbi:MAG: response regulator transcription factor [Salibacteraceae bacterium]